VYLPIIILLNARRYTFLKNIQVYLPIIILLNARLKISSVLIISLLQSVALYYSNPKNPKLKN